MGKESTPLLGSRTPQVQISDSLYEEYSRQKSLCGLVGWKRICCISCIASTTCILLVCMGVLLGAYFVINRDEPIGVTPIEEPIKVPDAPDPPILVKQEIESITIAWNEPDYHRSVIQAYEVQYSLALGEGQGEEDYNFTTHLPGPGVLREYRVNGLLAGSLYAFRVRAINEIGPGNYSLPSGYATLDATAPENPSSPLIVAVDDGSITLLWTEGNQNGAETTGFELQMAPSPIENEGRGKADPIWESVYEGSSQTVAVGGLLQASFYLFRARTLSSQGPSNWSAIAEYHTDYENATLPQAPALLILENRTCDSLSLTWERPNNGGSEILYYELFGFNSTGGSFFNETIALRNPESKTERTVIQNLAHFEIYQILNFAVNSFGSSLEGTFGMFRTLSPAAPDAPEAPIVTSASSNRIELQWKEPMTHCAPIQRYTLERDDWWLDEPFSSIYSGLNLTFEETDLLPAVTYNFRVSAESTFGNSPVSSVTSFTTFNSGACGNPEDVLVVKENFDTMQATIQNCLIRCATGGTECALECIMRELGLSEPCANCWVRMGLCTLNACAIECIRPSSEACLKCTEEKCFPDAVICTGMPDWSFPR